MAEGDIIVVCFGDNWHSASTDKGSLIALVRVTVCSEKENGDCNNGSTRLNKVYRLCMKALASFHQHEEYLKK